MTDSELPGDAPTDFDALLKDVLENPELIRTAKMSAEDLLELQKRINPYAGIGGPPIDPDRRRVRVAAASFTNLREDYLRRLTMTSLVGFLFQVFEEWEVPAAARCWVPAAPPNADPAAAAPYATGALTGRLEAALAVAREADAAAAHAAAAAALAAEAAAVAEPGETAAETAAGTAAAADADAAAKAAGLAYAAAHAAHRVGLEAGLRLRATAEAGMAFPAVRAILARAPMPPAPGQVTMPADAAKAIIGGFLRRWLEFDPSVHVRSGHDAKAVADAVARVPVGAGEAFVDTKDPDHLPLAAVLEAAPAPAPEHRAAFATITASPRAYAAAAALLHDACLADAALVALENEAAFRSYLFPVAAGSAAAHAATHVPPQDTFHRWAYYTEVNHDALRTVTEALYPERADLDWAIGLWEVFEGTPEETAAKFEAHCQRYQDECSSSIRSISFGGWTLLADFSENRKKIEFYNRHTEVLKRILDRHTADKKIGADLMRKRVVAAKAANIAEDGPDAAGLNKYRQQLAARGQDLAGKGVAKVISPEQMRRLEKAGGDVKAAQELELLEQHEETVRTLTALAKTRPLDPNEQRDLDFAVADLPRVREMVAVPPGAIQVDVFEHNTKTGSFTKTHFYTEAEAPPAPGEAKTAGAGAGARPEHPAVAMATAYPPPQLAPFAAEHQLSALAPRSDAARRAEAVRDSDSKTA